MELLSLLEALRTFGPTVAVVVFFLWRDARREDRLTDRINILEDEMRNVILPLVKDCSEVIAKNTAVMQQIEKHLEE